MTADAQYGDEISPESLQQLNALLEENTNKDLSEEEAAEVMKQVSAIPGGQALLNSLTQELSEGGGAFLGELLGQSSPIESGGDEFDVLLYQRPQSPLRLVFRVEVIAATRPYWRRLSLPTDASYCDLHFALEDAFESEDEDVTLGQGYRFEWRENDEVVATFLTGEESILQGDDYCVYQNQPIDLFSEGVERLLYLREGQSLPFLSVVMEKVIERNSFENQNGILPDCINGEGPSLGFEPSEITFRQPGVA